MKLKQYNGKWINRPLFRELYHSLVKVYAAYYFYKTDESMDYTSSLEQQIEKTKVILEESRENFAKNPESYSAQLLLMSTENYLADLLRELDAVKAPERKED